MAKSQNMAADSVQDASDAHRDWKKLPAAQFISDTANQIATAAEEQSHVQVK